MAKVRIKPVMGKEYLIYTGGEDSFKGRYIGKKPVETDWFLITDHLEGHIFVTLNKSNEIEFYHTRSLEKKLTLMWHSDGCDGPSWPAGFWTEKVEMGLSPLEKEHMTGRFKKWKENEAALQKEKEYLTRKLKKLEEKLAA